MQKQLFKLLFIAAMLFVPWTMRGQTLETYRFTTGVDTTRWITLTDPTIIWNSYYDDQASSVMNLGFNFTLCGETYSNFSVSSNGLFHLGSSSPSSGTQAAMFNSSYYQTSLPKITGIGRDLGTGSNGYIKYELTGTAPNRVFVCEYAMGYTYGSSYTGDVKWQIQLFEDSSKVAIVYGPVAPSTTPMTFHIGIGAASDDIVVIDPSTHTCNYVNGPTSTTHSTWPGAGRYYSFTPSTITCPKPITALIDSITAYSSFFTWSDTSGAIEWVVKISSASGSVTTTTFDTFYTFTGLNPNTDYSAQVASICDAGDTSLWRSVSFHTPCVDITTLPYSENFDSAPSGSSSYADLGVNCMSRLTDATMYYYPYVYNYNSYAHSGAQSLYWYNYGSSDYGFQKSLVLPGIDTNIYPMDTLQFSFWARSSSTSYYPYFQVGVLSNPNDMTTFQLIETVSISNRPIYNKYTVSLRNYQGNGKYICFRNGNTGSWTAYVDDFVIEVAPDCREVQNLAASGVSHNTATITWSEQDTATAWQFSYHPAGTPADSLVTLILNDSSYTLTSLTSNIEYTVIVSPVCDGLAGVDSLTFRTHCSPIIDTLPYFYSFESPTSTSSSSPVFDEPNCWYRMTDAYSYYYPYIASSSTYAHSGSYGLYWYNYYYANSGYGSYQYIVLPEFDSILYPVDTLQLRFWAKASSSSYSPVLQVGIVSDMDDPNSFTLVKTINVGNSTVWQEFEVPFNNYQGPHGHIAVAAVVSSNSTYTYLDDFTVEFAPACERPNHIAISAISDESVTLDWTAPDPTTTTWRIVYGVTGFDPNSDSVLIETALAHPWTINGLAPGTSYDVYIYTDCGDGNYSAPRPFTFRTACLPIDSLPYSYGFEGTTTGENGTLDPCWVKAPYNTTTNYPYPSTTAYEGTRSLYFYGYYSSNIKSYAALPMFQESTDMLQVSFRLRKSQNYSYYASQITVGLMENPYDISTFTPIQTCVASSTTVWDSFQVILYGHENAGRYIAFMSEAPNSTQYYNYVYLDDVVVDYAPECGPVNDIHSTVSVTSALIGWTPSLRGESLGGTIEYRDITDSLGSWNEATTSTNLIALTNLDPATTYEARIYNTCDDGNSPYVYYTFTTSGYTCTQPDTTMPAIDTIAGGTSTSTYLPIYSFYKYGMSQQIYLANELNGLGSINHMRLQTSASAQTRIWDIYLSHTSENSVDHFLPVENPVLVYSDTVNYDPGNWIDFEFTTPFSFNGSSNLLVTVVDRTGSYVSGNAAYTHSLPDGRSSCYAYRDGTPYAINDYSGVTPYTLNVRNNMIFSGYACSEHSTCAAPAVMVTAIHSDGVTLEWVSGAGESSWDLYYMQDADTGWTYVGEQFGNSYTLSGLGKGLPYKAKLVTVCGDDEFPAQVSFFIPCPTIDTLPFYEDFNSYTSSTYSSEAPDCWYSGSTYSSSYPYFDTYTSHGGSGASMYMYNSRYSNPDAWTYITLPAIDSVLGDMSNVQATFWATNSYNGYNHYIVVGVSVDPEDISTFTPVDTFRIRYNRWEMYECTFERYSDSGRYITFASMSDPGSYCYPYLDDITIEAAPSCQRPNHLNATTTSANSVQLSWRARSDAAQFAIEYGPVGFTPGTGTTVIANSNPYVLTGLPIGYQGEYRVRNICGAGDTSDYSADACIFTLPQVPATIPYSYNFEDATEWNNWHVSSNNHINWYRGNGTPAANGNYSMYVSGDFGATLSTDMDQIVNASVWRDFDFGTTANAFEFSFKHKEGGTLSNTYDALMVFITDTNNPVVSSEDNITSPWGDVNSIEYIYAARLDTNWTSARVAIDSMSGVKRVAFFWFNQDLGTTYPWIYGPAAIDDIEMIVSPCPRVQGLRVDSLSSTTATLSWNATPGVTYRVAYRSAGSTPASNQYVTTTTNNVTLTGLSEVTNYIAFVQKICGTDSSIFSDGVEFQTEICESAEFAYSYHPSDSPSSSSYLPIGYSTYNYSYVQSIIDADLLSELTSPEIIALAFNPIDPTCGDYFTNIDIYMANVSETNLSSGFIMPDSNHQFVQLTHGADLTYTAGGWKLVGFDTTFTWDGQSNILLTVNRRHGSWSSGANFNSHSTGSVIKSRYLYQDSGPYNPNTITPSSGTALAEVGDLQLFVCGVPVCHEPTLAGETHTYYSATINWTGEGTAYEVNIKDSAAATWPDDIAVTANTYTFSSLQPATTYTYRVRTDCNADSIGYSDWVEGTLVTDSLPCFVPSNLQVTAVTNATATFDWTPNGQETAWDIHVWFTGGIDSIYRVTTHPATVGGYLAGLTYSASVRALCGVNFYEGEWSDTISFTTATCPDVTGLSTSNVTENSVTLNWNSSELAQSYSIEYGYSGFDQGTGTTVTANSNSIVISDLECETPYDFYVKAVCGTDWNSENWVHASATTAGCAEECDAPYGVNTTVTGNSVFVSWSAPQTSTSFEIEYGTHGFSHGSGTVVSSTETSATINGLDFNTQYDLYVRALCGDDIYSRWSNVSTFTTETQSIGDVNAISCAIYPNPTSSATTISVNGVNGKVKIEIVDMNGRTVASETLECSSDCTKTMDVDNLSQGAYFVRITSDNANMVRKLIVR